MADEFYVLELDYLVVAGQRYCKQEFIVLSTVQGACIDIHIELFGHDRRLVVNGDALLIDAAPRVALFADVYQFGRKAI